MKLNVAVSKIAVMRIDNFVSTLKNDYNFKEEDLLVTKDKMLSFVNNYLNQVFQRLNNTSPYKERYAVNYCYWNDGISPYSWVFDYKMYFNQHIAIIYNFRSANKFYENKEVKAVLNLMERMNLIEKKVDTSYKIIGSNIKFGIGDGVYLFSKITLQNNSGQVCHIAEDDHCYVLYSGLNLNDDNCKQTTYIFPEAFKALTYLSPPL